MFLSFHTRNKDFTARLVEADVGWRILVVGVFHTEQLFTLL